MLICLSEVLFRTLSQVLEVLDPVRPAQERYHFLVSVLLAWLEPSSLTLLLLHGSQYVHRPIVWLYITEYLVLELTIEHLFEVLDTDVAESALDPLDDALLKTCLYEHFLSKVVGTLIFLRRRKKKPSRLDQKPSLWLFLRTGLTFLNRLIQRSHRPCGHRLITLV